MELNLFFLFFLIYVDLFFFYRLKMNKNKTPSKNDDMNETSFTHQSDDDSVKRSLSLQYGEDEQIKILKSEKNSLKKKLEEKEETLRKLKMVKLYRNKVFPFVS